MTIAAAWVRRIGSCEELIFISDSRLSGDGNTFDSCPKTFALPRNDCVISFAGYTGHAYPMMMQLISAIDSHGNSKGQALFKTPNLKSEKPFGFRNRITISV
jgi:hypothetical protein